MVTDIDQVRPEMFVDTLVGMYYHWVALCFRRRGERRRAVLAVVARRASAIVSSAAVAAARAVLPPSAKPPTGIIRPRNRGVPGRPPDRPYTRARLAI